jgi:hypothetical protein
MARIDDPAYLRHEQYRTSGNLQARIDFHVRFRTNPYDWQLWVFDRLRLPAEARVLEIGCGAGSLWLENRARIPRIMGCLKDLLRCEFAAVHGLLQRHHRMISDKSRIRFQHPAASRRRVLKGKRLIQVPDGPSAPETRLSGEGGSVPGVCGAEVLRTPRNQVLPYPSVKNLLISGTFCSICQIAPQCKEDSSSGLVPINLVFHISQFPINVLKKLVHSD